MMAEMKTRTITQITNRTDGFMLLDEAVWKIKFLSETIGGYNGELPLTMDACFGMSKVLENLIEDIKKASELL